MEAAPLPVVKVLNICHSSAKRFLCAIVNTQGQPFSLGYHVT